MMCLIGCYLFGVIMYLVGLVMDMLIMHEDEPMMKLVGICLIWPVWFIFVIIELIIQAIAEYR